MAGDSEAVAFHLTSGSDTVGPNDMTSLHLAAHYGHQNVVDTLLKHGDEAALSATTKNSFSPLHIAGEEE